MPCACTIAGLDSGGGAGITADIKTFSAFGVWGCSVVTSVTAQNPTRVAGFWNLKPDAVSLQIAAVLEDFSISAFKTGMLPTQEIILAVINSVPEDIPLVTDPVIVSTSGKKLIDKNAFTALKDLLLPRCTILTPNIPEACAISGIEKISCEEEIIKAGEILLSLGAENVLIKGGHLKGSLSEDYLFSDKGMIKFSGKRVPYQIHGSGCSLSSAIAAGLSKKNSVENSCGDAKRFIEESIKHAYQSKSGLYSINPTQVKTSYPNNKHYISKD